MTGVVGQWGRRVVPVLAAAGLLTAALPALSVTVPTCLDQISGLNDRCEQWARVFNDRSPDGSPVADTANALVVDPGGARVYVATTTDRSGSAVSRATVAALSTHSKGGALWLAHPPTRLGTTAVAATLSQRPKLLIVAGTETYLPNLNTGTLVYWLTTAYRAGDGRVAWSSSFRLGGDYNTPITTVPDPRGRRVYVVGYSRYSAGYAVPYVEWVTIAYSSRTGRQLWVRRYGGTADGQNRPVGLAVAPDGRRVYVAGTSEHPEHTGVRTSDEAVICYDAPTGRQVWRRITHVGSDHAPTAFGISRGDTVVLTGTATFGTSTKPTTNALTIAYSARTGRVRWNTHAGSEQPVAVAAAPHAATVYVGGSDQGGFQVRALSTATGRARWTATYSPPAGESAMPQTLVVNPRGTRIYAAGVVGAGAPLTEWPVVVAFSSAGKELWTARYDLRDPTGLGTESLATSFRVQPVAIRTDAAGAHVYLSVDDQPAACRGPGLPAEVEHCADARSDLVLSYAG